MALIEANLRKQRITIKHHPNRMPPPPPPPPKGAPATAPPKGARASTPPPPAGIAFETASEITEIESSAAAATSSEGGGKRSVGKGANTLSEIATSGVSEGSRIAVPVDVTLTDAIEIISATPAAVDNLEKSTWAR